MDNPSGKRRGLRIALLLVLLVVAAFGGYHWYLSSQVASRLATIREAGDPVTVDDLKAMMNQVAPEQNAAVRLETLGLQLGEHIDAARPVEPDSGFGFPNPSADNEPAEKDARPYLPFVMNEATPNGLEPIADETRAAMRAFLVEHGDLMAAIREAARLPDAEIPKDFDADFVSWVVGSSSGVREAARGLAMAALDAALRGDSAPAVSDIETMLRIGAIYDDEPTLLMLLIRRAIHSTTVASLEQVLSRVEMTEPTIDRLAARLESEEAIGAMRYMMVTERLGLIELFQNDIEKVLMEGNPGMGGYVEAKIGVVTGSYDRATIQTADYYGELVNAAERPEHKRIAAANKAAGALPTNHAAQMMAIDGTRPMKLDLAAIALLRAARQALLIERHRLRTDSLPASLDDLGERDRLNDPFTGKPLGYAATEDGGFVVFSFGNDTTDDGGKRHPDGRYDEPGYDIVFEVRPALRGE